MTQVLVQGRKFILLILSVLSLKGAWITFTNPILIWGRYWATHHAQILTLTAVNTVITTASEIGSRTIVPALSQNPHEDSFLIKQADGTHRIHKQSLINIFMTLFASLLGGPVFFIKKRLFRFIFFASFGAFNSLLAQSLSGIVTHGFFYIATQRLIFDLVYNSSFKFFMFEYVRPLLLDLQKKFAHIAAVRILQDFLTTFFRVVMLSLLGLKG